MKNADIALAVSALTGMPMGVWSLHYVNHDEDDSESREDVSLCAVILTDRTHQRYLDFLFDGERCIECDTPPSIEQDQDACADLMLREKLACEIRDELSIHGYGTYALSIFKRDQARDEIMAKAVELVSRTPLLSYAQATNLMLKEACDKGDFVQARKLIESGKDPMAFEHHALRAAIKYGQADIVEWMLSNHYLCNETMDVNLLCRAILEGLNRKETDDLNLARTVRSISNHMPLGKRITIFGDAIRNGRPETLKALLEISRDERKSAILVGQRIVMNDAANCSNDIYIEILLRNGFSSDGSPRVQAIADRLSIETSIGEVKSRSILRRTAP